MSNDKIIIPLEATPVDTLKHFIGNEWVATTVNSLQVNSPLYGQNIAKVMCANKSDVDLAVDIAKKAQKDWAAQSLKSRCQIMFKFRDILLRDMKKIAECISLENGKTLAESKAGIMKGVEVLEYALSLQNLDGGAKMEVSKGVNCEYIRSPLGVVASISPFNFPAMVPMWTIPISITLGNALVWKPSEKTPLTSYFIAEAFKEAGLPAGIFSVLQGNQECAEAIIDHHDIKAISFVGSTKIARLVYERASSHGKRCLALGGAKNHIILLPDADKEISGIGISDSFTGCAGQRCMAASVLLAVGETNSIIDSIKQRASSQELGVTMGALITKEQRDFLHQEIENAVAEGATLILDGRNPQLPAEAQAYAGGYWLGPTILDNVKPGSKAATFELFGPVLSIIRCQNITEALAVQNTSNYGNACSVFTTSGSLADIVIKQASAGMVGVNIGVPVPREPFSFGGINDSKFGHGDITGDHSLDFWSDMKKVTTKWEMQKDHNWMS